MTHAPARMQRARRSALAALAGPLVAAQAAPPEPAAPQQIEIRVDAQAQRRADLAGRQVVTRDELLRHGDTRLADALQRVPGVGVEGRGQATELKLGGLGSGYTQLLLNGVPVPPGFSLDSVALESIERVEIVRGATVQTSQAVAGSINLVTRRTAPAATREAKLGLASQWGRPQASVALDLGDRAGDTRWGLGLVASSERLRWPAVFEQERREGDAGTLTQRTRTDKHEDDRTDALSLNPRLSWKREDGDGGSWQFGTDHSLRYAVSRGGVSDRRTPLEGPPPAQQDSQLALNYDRLFWRGRAQLQARAAGGAQTELRLNATHARRDQDSRLLGQDFTPLLVQDSTVQGRAIDQQWVLNLDHQRPLGEAHRLDAGLEWEQARRREDRVQVEQALPGGLPPENLDERYDARVRRAALYLQDEWTVGAGTEAQLGLRVERLHTDSEGNVFDGVRQSHRLVGPVARLAVTPGDGLGTFKLGLSRGFRLPAPRDVMPRRYVPVAVSPTTPASTGNPDLRPERAWSLDASWQRAPQPTPGGWVVSAALRRIDDVILDRLVAQPQVQSAPWLLERFNGGRAWAASLEFEWRGEAPVGLFDGAPLRWSSSLAFNRSRLSGVAGEHPAIAGQAPWQLKLDLTQPIAPGWTAQLGGLARGAAVADQPAERRLAYPSRHSLSAGLSWQPRPRSTWRLSAAQLAATDEVDEKTVRTSEGGVPVTYRSSEAWQRETLWRVAFETGF